MRRREFITLLGSATAWPLAARAQQTDKVHRIALVHPSAAIAEMNETGDHPGYLAFFQALRRLGYVEGRNLVVERYSGEGRIEHYAELVRDVVRLKPDLIFVASGPMLPDFKTATTTIPIVGLMGDPLLTGIVGSLARPGGNITGISVIAGSEIWGKRLQILLEIVPTASKVGLLASSQTWKLPQGTVTTLREAAARFGISLLGPPLESIQQSEYRRVFEVMAGERADALIVGDQPEHSPNRRLIVDLAAKARLPTLYPYRVYFDVGGLIVYGSDFTGVYRRAADYIDQILRGARPGELPIYQETKFELLLNLKAARALGLTIPTSLLVRADEVIE
jgi:putative ABC transport system substrate-binding protein